MKAVVDDQILAESDDTVDCAGYSYFPADAVKREHLEITAKTDADLRCPHGVQFYDVVVRSKRYLRAAWMYEAPQPKMAATAERYGFWKEVAVG